MINCAAIIIHSIIMLSECLAIVVSSVGQYTKNTIYRGIKINTASFLQISKYRDSK